jgi:glutathione S-transferase
MMILHDGWRSSASRRVRLCLAEKGLAYEGHVVDMAAMEHHSPEYLRINPLGVIPTLIHDGRPLHESGTICEYLDEEIAPDEMTEKKHPRVAAWWTRLQARPAYAQANFGPFVDS